jgi:hypothetical protein
MSNLKPWFPNPDPSRPEAVAFPQASVTHPDAKLSGPIPGRYESTVATKSPGAGELKPLAGGTKMPISSKSSSKPQTGQTPGGPIPAQKGTRGKGTPLRGPRTIVP